MRAFIYNLKATSSVFVSVIIYSVIRKGAEYGNEESVKEIYNDDHRCGDIFSSNQFVSGSQFSGARRGYRYFNYFKPCNTNRNRYIDIPILLLGTWKFGWKFIISTIYCLGIVSPLTNYLSAHMGAVTEDTFLASLNILSIIS